MTRELRALALLAASPLAFAATMANAQTADTDEVAPDDAVESPIIVIGTRGALRSAEEFKRDSSVLVDAISADDMGALPDESIADALVRIPGLSANNNENGFAEISIRGLGPDLANTTYNGRVLPSTRRGNRRNNLGDLPSEGIQRAWVQKTAAASTIEGGAGGTIGLRSVHPLETRRDGLTLVGRVITDDVAQDIKDIYGFKPFGYRGEVSYIHQFGERFGIALTYAHIQQTNARPSTQLVNYAERPLSGDVDGDGYIDIVPDDVSVNMGANNQRRDSVLGMVQWRPIDALTASLDGYYIDTRNTSHPIHFIGRNLSIAENPPTTYTVKDSVVTQYEGYAGFYETSVHDDAAKTQQIQGGFNLKYDNGGPFSVSFDVSYAQAKFSAHNRSASLQTDTNIAKANPPDQARPIGFDARDPRHITLDFGDQSADDYALRSINLGNPENTDTAKAMRLDFRYNRPLAFIGSMDFGMRVDNRVKKVRPDGNSYGFGKAPNRPDIDSSYLIPGTNRLADAAEYLGGPNAVTFPLFDLEKLMAFADDPRAIYNDQPTNDLTGRSTIIEDTAALYYQANIDAGRLTGNLGVRYFVTDETVKGFAATASNGPGSPPANVTPLRVRHSYSYLLPALNLRYAITQSLFARGALSKTLSRPPYGDMQIGSSVDYTMLQPGDTIRRGNPDLKPYTSKNADLALEWYPSKAMTLGVQLYYKRVKNFIRNDQIEGMIVRPDGTSVPVTINTSTNDPAGHNFYGFELIARRDFNFLPGFLRHFGLRLDYSHNWTDQRDSFTSVARTPGPGGAKAHKILLPPNNFNPWTANAQLYFTKRNVDIRLAYRYYAPFVRDNTGGFQYRPGGTLDLSGSVALVRGIRLHATIRNLTATHAYSRRIDYRYPDNFGMARNVFYPGRSFSLGIRAKF